MSRQVSRGSAGEYLDWNSAGGSPHQGSPRQPRGTVTPAPPRASWLTELQGSTVSSTRLQHSQAKKMPTREAASLLCCPGRAPWDASQAFFSLLETCLSDCGGERYLPNHSSHCPGRERALSYFWGEKKDLLLVLAGYLAGAGAGALLYALPCRCWIL